MRKLNNAKSIVDVITDKELRFIIVIFLISLYLLVTAFYSYGKVNLSELEHIETTVDSVKTDTSGKANFVTFSNLNGERFYITVNGLPKGSAKDLTKALELVSANNGEVTIYYTNRRVLLLNFYSFSSYHRVVAMETESEVILSLDDYNNAVKQYFIGCLVGSVLLILIAVFFIKI